MAENSVVKSSNLLDNIFAQCKKALLHLKKFPQEMEIPLCFEDNASCYVIKDKEGLSIEGWTKTRQWQHIYYTLKIDDSEERYVDGVII